MSGQGSDRSGKPSRRSSHRGFPMSFLSSGVAAVTGACSGIGRALAVQLAAAGSALALADVDQAGLQQTAQSLEKKSALASTHVVDVADEDAMRSFAEDAARRHGRVTLLINNAGIALHGDFEEVSLDDCRLLMNINFWGTIYGVKYFLPMLKREKRAHIVNISSVYGIVAPTVPSAYASTNFAHPEFPDPSP